MSLLSVTTVLAFDGPLHRKRVLHAKLRLLHVYTRENLIHMNGQDAISVTRKMKGLHHAYYPRRVQADISVPKIQKLQTKRAA